MFEMRMTIIATLFLVFKTCQIPLYDLVPVYISNLISHRTLSAIATLAFYTSCSHTPQGLCTALLTAQDTFALIFHCLLLIHWLAIKYHLLQKPLSDSPVRSNAVVG